MFFKLNLFCHNITYLVFNIFSSRLVFLGPYSANPVITPLIEAFRGVHGLKLGKCIPWFCLNLVCIIKSILLYSNLSFGEREMSSGANWCGKTLKLLLKVLANVTICLLLPEQAGHRFVCSSLSEQGTDLAEILCIFRLSFRMLWTTPLKYRVY